MPLDYWLMDHFILHEGLVLWLTLITCLQQVIPFPITLQQAKAAAVTLSLLLLQCCSHSLQVADVLLGMSVLKTAEHEAVSTGLSTLPKL